MKSSILKLVFIEHSQRVSFILRIYKNILATNDILNSVNSITTIGRFLDNDLIENLAKRVKTKVRPITK
jgi:hypothetical protein